MFCYVLDFITLVVHEHGRGAHIGTYLVQQQCVSCAMAFAAYLNVSMSWSGAGMHEACGLARGQYMPHVPWPLLRASPMLDAIAQSRYMHTHNTHSCDMK